MIYQAYQAYADGSFPLRQWARAAAPVLGSEGIAGFGANRRIAAACRTYTLSEVTHRRPAFGIERVSVAGTEVEVTEEAVHTTPFATLLRFRKAGVEPQPRVLLAAPMSGHFATLLRDTVRTMLPDHDVYITDWHNARDVPLAAGRFGLDEYTEHLMDFLRVLGPGGNLVAICQPCVASLAAVALMAEDGDPG